MNPQDLLRARTTVNSFDQVHQRITEMADLNIPDVVADMKDLRVHHHGKRNPQLLFTLPHLGTLSLTAHAERQIGSLLGCRFGKWFDPEVVSPEEIQRELQLRFSARNLTCKVRARKHLKGAAANNYSDGFARAFLSPTYSPIDDVRIFDRLAVGKRSQLEEMGFIKDHLGTDFYNDRASHYTVVNKDPLNLGPINRDHPDPHVRAIYKIAEAEGALPDADYVYQGFHIRNSEVGFTAITIDSTTFRLVCLNGAIVTIADGRLLYRMHKSIRDDEIDSLLDGAFDKMGPAQDLNQKRMKALQSAHVEDVKAEIKGFLEKAKATKSFIEQVNASYEEEPLGTAYGVWQALTRAAQKEEDMEKRQELEQLGGKYLVQAGSKHMVA